MDTTLGGDIVEPRPEQEGSLLTAVMPPTAPHRRGWSRAAPCLPWAEGTGRPWPGWHRLLATIRFVPLYLGASWLLFWPTARPVPGNIVIDSERLRPLLYEIPDLSQDRLGFLLSMLTAPWLNHNLVQLVYVTLLLLLAGIPFEVREGTGRTVVIFFGTTLAGAVAAGILLHLLYPELVDSPFWQQAWERTWSGGSAGAFGLIGATAARARRPLPLLALVVLWEANLVVWYLREYTPAFHLSALAVGFIVARYALPPLQRRPAVTAP